jgi:SpoIIAA-like
LSFRIIEHAAEGILEVVYPEAPTAADVARYLREARAAIDRLRGRFRGPWSCLVDQRALPVLPPELAADVAMMNEYAQERGMRRSARLVASAVGAKQVERLAKRALGVPVRVFQDREAAMRWLKER